MEKRTNEYLLGDLKQQVKRVSIAMDVPKKVRKIIEVSDSAVILNLTVPYNGSFETRTAIRVRHTLPSGGGGRIALVKNLTEALSEAEFLAFLMSLKLGVGYEPFGGAKAVLITDPKSTPRDLLDLLFEEFGRQMAPFMVVEGESLDRIAPDMYTNHRDMECFLKGVKSVLGGKIPDGQIRALATGKKPDGTSKGGLFGRPESTGAGVAYMAKLGAEKIGLPLKGATFVVQGFGKVGIPAAERMIGYGAKLIAVSDSKGGVVNYDGLDLEKLKAFKKEKGTVVGFSCTTFVTSADLLELECDILLPSAMEGQITADNAPKIKAKIVSEGSNMGFTGKAKKIMSENGIEVWEGIIANMYGVVASNVEARQNRDGRVRTFEEVIEYLDEKMDNSFKEVLIRMEKYGLNIPDATLALGIENLVKMRTGTSLEELIAQRSEK